MSAIPTYYDRPALKPAPWKAYVPAYLYVGGLAGSAAVLAGCAQLDPALGGLVRRARRVAAVGIPVGTALLVVDMGRPSRFLNVLRVFRPTSVINVGSWLLSYCGTASVAALVLPPGLARVAGANAAVSGAFVATYTGALLSNTATPLWSRARRTMPFVFAGSAVASTGCLLLPVAEGERERRVLTRLVVGGAVVEGVGKALLEREVGPVHAREPLERGSTGALWTASKVLSAAALVLVLTTRSRAGRVAVAALGTAAAVAGRFALHEAGKRSALDPRAAFERTLEEAAPGVGRRELPAPDAWEVEETDEVAREPARGGFAPGP